MTSIARPDSVRGVFLERVEITVPRSEILVEMRFSTKKAVTDPATGLVSEMLVDSKVVGAISSDKGKTFKIGGLKDVDGDGDIDRHDQAKLIALAKAYSAIINP
ncbi:MULTISPECIES: hypothetical protein [Pseudomonas]|uniref:hypothetical protein n=1 Tax=Pseudomonas TaxID=286 RepID=UPI000D43E070|nr:MULTISPECIES: hypothetical protein [Pseudomonas]PTS98916.1 hypothetical protein DBR24_13915 [Pseudomonas sp. HMWF006]PTT68281.1 hypothetical protein DBR26_13630 [Pseudomonas sp. HMWF007]PTT89777.1 hypothetical protein DBR29_14905 [Pseudomonas sp. HMWF005]QXI00689.1 hypothetical protein HV782_001435 [Pseudomonas monsensis]